MERVSDASRSSGELASATPGGGRSVRVIPLRHPPETPSRGSTSPLPSWWRAAVGKARAMGPLEWAEGTLPCVAWMRRYRWKEDLQADLAAGITVGVMLVPQKERIVALSTCEAEYIAASSAACQRIWLARLLGELMNKIVEGAVLKVDNQSALALIKNPVLHDKSKHIKIRFHFIRQSVEDGGISPCYIRGDDQLADILTKALPRVRFLDIRDCIGMCSVEAQA